MNLRMLEIRDTGYCEMLVCTCEFTGDGYSEYKKHPKSITIGDKHFWRMGWDVVQGEVYYLP